MLDDVVAQVRRHRDHHVVANSECISSRSEFLCNSKESSLVKVDEIHLVHCKNKMPDVEQCGHCQVPPGLFDNALSRVDQDDDKLGSRRTGHHVAGVLDMPGCVGEHELALRRGEVAVRNIDRDALFALGPQPVGQQRKLDAVVPAVATRPLDCFEGVREHRLGVMQQPPDQRRFAVIDRTGRRKAQHLDVRIERRHRHGSDQRRGMAALSMTDIS